MEYIFMKVIFKITEFKYLQKKTISTDKIIQIDFIWTKMT